MGYTHYWYREKEVDEQTFSLIVSDFKVLLPKFQEFDIKLGDGVGENLPILNNYLVCFNGKSDCGHDINERISIPWPDENAGGVMASNKPISGTWMAGSLLNTRHCDGDCSYETFYFPRTLNEDWQGDEHTKHFQFCKTGFRPYDVAVTAFLIIAKYHLKDRIKVSSDGNIHHWFDAKLLCQMELGYGMDFQLG